MAYQIELSPQAEEHLAGFTARHQAIIVSAIETQLRHQPGVETRNRKRMRPNQLAPWELRIDNFRVYYDIQTRPALLVLVLAVGVKIGNRVFIGGKEVQL